MPQKPLDQTLPIDGFKGGVGPAKGAMRPDTSHQEVPAELIWRLYNARKPFNGWGSAHTPLGSLQRSLDPQILQLAGRRLAVPF